jgi:hypothetical protein
MHGAPAFRPLLRNAASPQSDTVLSELCDRRGSPLRSGEFGVLVECEMVSDMVTFESEMLPSISSVSVMSSLEEL